MEHSIRVHSLEEGRPHKGHFLGAEGLGVEVVPTWVAYRVANAQPLIVHQRCSHNRVAAADTEHADCDW